MTTIATAPRRYHHGDLRQALVLAGTELAREGGPSAIVLREAARRVGVSPNAAYRHFDDLPALIDAVAHTSRRALGRFMRVELARVDRTGNVAEDAIEALNATGRGYVEFALAEPGLFASAFLCEFPDEIDRSDTDAPDVILTEVLEELVAAGVMPIEHSPFAFAHSWAAAHGLATLLLGPLSAMPADQRAVLIDASINLIGRGLASRP